MEQEAMLFAQRITRDAQSLGVTGKEYFDNQLEELRQELDNLPDELRKAGGLPGWIR